MASDIIAQGMAASAGQKASLALEKVEGIAGGIKYIGEVDYYENLPSKPQLGDGYTVRYKTGGTDPDGREFVWGKSQDGTKKWIEFGPDLDPILTEIAKKKGKSGTGTGAEIFNDYTNNKAKGEYAHAEGYQTSASGNYSHAEGKGTKATATSSHAEGDSTIASTLYAHAEGSETTASGIGSHAEGWRTTAKGPYSHAEGCYTYASSGSQHVQGKFNKWDTEGKYAHIVGNGTSNATASLSNAHTLDWEGNAWYAGKVSGGTVENPAPVENDNDYVTKKYFDENKGAPSQIVDADLYTLTDPINKTYYRNIGTLTIETPSKEPGAIELGKKYTGVIWDKSYPIDEIDTWLNNAVYTEGSLYMASDDSDGILLIAADYSMLGLEGKGIFIIRGDGMLPIYSTNAVTMPAGTMGENELVLTHGWQNVEPYNYPNFVTTITRLADFPFNGTAFKGVPFIGEEIVAGDRIDRILLNLHIDPQVVLERFDQMANQDGERTILNFLDSSGIEEPFFIYLRIPTEETENGEILKILVVNHQRSQTSTILAASRDYDLTNTGASGSLTNLTGSAGWQIDNDEFILDDSYTVSSALNNTNGEFFGKLPNASSQEELYKLNKLYFYDNGSYYEVKDASNSVEVSDSLNDYSTNKALSANQGALLRARVETLENLGSQSYVDLTTLGSGSTLSMRSTTYELTNNSSTSEFVEIQSGQTITQLKFDTTKTVDQMVELFNSMTVTETTNKDGDTIYYIPLINDNELLYVDVTYEDASTRSNPTYIIWLPGDRIGFTNKPLEIDAGITEDMFYNGCWCIASDFGEPNFAEGGSGIVEIGESVYVNNVNSELSSFVLGNGMASSTESSMAQFAVGESVSSISFNPNLTTEQIQQRIQEIQQNMGSNLVDVFEATINGESAPIITIGNFDQTGQEYIQVPGNTLWSAISADNIDGVPIKEGWCDSFSYDVEGLFTLTWDKSTYTLTSSISLDITNINALVNGSILGKNAIAAEGNELHYTVLPSAIYGIPYETFFMPVRDSNGSIITENSGRTLDFTVKVNETEVYTGTLTYSNDIEGATGYMNDGFVLLLNYYYDPNSGMVSQPGTANFVMLETVSSDASVILESIYKKTTSGGSNSESGGGSTETNNSITQTDGGFEVSYTNGKVLLPFRFGGNLNAYISDNKVNIESYSDNNYDNFFNKPIENVDLRYQYFTPEVRKYYRHTGSDGVKEVAPSVFNHGDVISSIKFNTNYDIESFLLNLPYNENNEYNLLTTIVLAPSDCETGVYTHKVKIDRDYSGIDSFLSGIDYSGLANGEPYNLITIDSDNTVAAFKYNDIYILGYMISGNATILYSTGDNASMGVTQGWQNLPENGLLDLAGNISYVREDAGKLWNGSLISIYVETELSFLYATYQDSNYRLATPFDRIWYTGEGWQNLDDNGVYDFSIKLQEAIGASEISINNIDDYNSWNGNLAMKNEQLTVDTTEFKNGYVYFYDDSNYYVVDGKSSLSIAPIDTLVSKNYSNLTISNSLKIVDHYPGNGTRQNLLSVSNNVGFKKLDAIYSIVFNTSTTTTEIDNYLSKFAPTMSTRLSGENEIFPLIETYNYYGLYGVKLAPFGGTGYALAICNAESTTNFTVMQVVYVSEYTETNLTILQNFKSDFTYTNNGWQDTNEYVFDSVIYELARDQADDIKQDLIDELVCYFNTDKHLWRGIKKLSQNRDICRFTINPSEWIESADIAPFKYMVSKTYALDILIDEDCPLMSSFDNLINSTGVAIAEITGTDNLNITFYAVNKPSVEITGTIGGVR